MSMDDLRAAFDMVDAIKAIVRCESSMALRVLKKVIDDRIGELEGLTLKLTLKDEQVTQKPEQKAPIVEQIHKKHEQREEKAERKGKKHAGPRPLFGLDQVLRRYGSVAIYKPVVDVVLDKIPDEFSYRDVAKIILSFLLTKGRVITGRSSDKYAALYIKYLRTEKMIIAERRGCYRKSRGKDTMNILTDDSPEEPCSKSEEETVEREWTKGEEDILESNFFKMGVKGIVEKKLLNRTEGEITKEAKYRGMILGD